jgi:hypothetical protein
MSLFERERTSAETILYALYLYFLGLRFRNTFKAIQVLEKERGGRSQCCYMEMGSEIQSKTSILL